MAFGLALLFSTSAYSQTTKWTPDACKTEAAKASVAGGACLSKTNYFTRRECFFALGPARPAGFGTSCQNEWNAATKDLAAKDKAAYPKDCSAVIDNGTCVQPKPTATPAPNPTLQAIWKADKCKVETMHATQAGTLCLNKAAYTERRACFFAIGPARPEGYSQFCMNEWTAAMADLAAKDKAAHPGDCSAVIDNGTCHQPTPTPANAWSDDKCKTETAKVLSSGVPCLTKSVYQERRACIFAIGPARPAGYIDHCTAQWSAAMNDLAAKDKAAHPSDCSAVIDNGTCVQPTSRLQSQQPSVDCAKIVGSERAQGIKCAGYSTTASRKSCIDAVYATIDKASKGAACGYEVLQLNEELKQIEAQKYPKQTPAVQ